MKYHHGHSHQVGVFAGGVDFHPIAFLTVVRKVYETLVTRAGTVEAMSPEHEAFFLRSGLHGWHI